MAEYDAGSRHVQDPFQEARKEAQKLRLALDGPSGSGKTFSSLMAAAVLAEHEQSIDPTSKGIAFIDTEHGSGALYADQFTFRHVNLDPPYSPARYIALIKAAAEHGYSVCVIDSLSHGWNALGGVLDMVDNAAARSGGNKFAGWKEGTPAQNALIEAILTSPIHVIATMRTAQEWILEETGKGTKAPRRVGMKPVQRDGVEYEFTLVGDLDLEHRLTISKSRALPIADRVVSKPGPAFFTEILDWLRSGTPMATPKQIEEITVVRNALDDDARGEANVWFKATGYRMANLSAEEATTVIEHLKGLSATPTAPKPKAQPATPEPPVQAPEASQKPRGKAVGTSAPGRRTPDPTLIESGPAPELADESF